MERGGPWVEHRVVYHWLQNLFRQKEVGVNTLHALTLQCCLLLGIPLCPSVFSLSLGSPALSSLPATPAP